MEESYSTSDASVSGSEAVNLVYQYLQKTPVDGFTRLTPTWTYEHHGQIETNQSRLWRGLGLSPPVPCQGFRATVQLPHKTPLLLPVSGGIRKKKKEAQR